VAELKNTLSLPFFLAALLAYGQAEAAAEAGRSPRGPYLLAGAGFLLALLGKGSVVMFPAVLLLRAWWLRGRVTGRDLRWTAPFFALSAVFGALTLRFQLRRALVSWSIPWDGPASRLAVAGRNFLFYLAKGAWPSHLLPLYPQGRIPSFTAVDLLRWSVLVLLIAGLGSIRTRWSRAALFGLGFFFLNLVPVVGFVPMAYFHLAWAADHFAYLPLLGLAGLAGAGLGCLRSRPVGAGLAVVLALVLAAAARTHAAFFHDEESLWSRTLEANPHAWLALNNLGDVRMEQGRGAEALALFAQAVAENAAYAEAESNWGLALALAGRPAEAIPHDRNALRLNPALARADVQWGNALLALGRPAEAEDPYRAALRLEPGGAEAEGNLGVALMAQGRLAEALEHDTAAVRLDPSRPAARINLGNALARAGEPAAAVEQYQAALRLGADEAALHYNLAVALGRLGRRAEAIGEFEAVLRLQPQDGEARQRLAALQGG
jgi:tetratricopeptide (TPR) repeat protein